MGSALSREALVRDYCAYVSRATLNLDDARENMDTEVATEMDVQYNLSVAASCATLAHAAATLLAAMPEPAQPTHEDTLRRMAETIEAHRRDEDAVKERDALRDRVDELVAQGLANQRAAARGWSRPVPAPEKHEPGTAPLCTCGHHPDQHFDGPRSMRAMCDDCPCSAYTPNTTEVDGWSEPDARGARFRVARFEQNGHVPPVYFKVTDQLGVWEPKAFSTEPQAQRYADYANRTFGSTSTDASVETEAPSRLHTDTPTTE